jgi:hypothetical protein
MLKGLCLGILVVMILMAVAQGVSAQSDLVLELRINNTSHAVYDSSGHSFIASYLTGLLVGLAAGSGSTLTGGGAGYHMIGFEQALGEPVFLAFSQGDWRVIDNMMVDIDAGDFLDYISPSFAFGLGTRHPLKVALGYSGIDIEGGLAVSRGIYKLVIENMGQSGGRPLVEIRDVV